MKSDRRAFLLLAAIAVLAYAPLFWQPLLEDDWPNIVFARQWTEMLAHPVYRYRALWWMLTAAVDAVFGVRAWAFYAVSIALHVIATWLVYLAAKRLDERVALWAAAFFAAAEGHQEAVMWYSASAETLMFVFGVAAVLCWMGRRHVWAMVLFAAALATKETAVIFAPLMLVVDRRWKQWLPYAGIAAAYVALLWTGRAGSFRFADGSFSLAAPFWITWPVSYTRMLWIWGLLALAVTRKWPVTPGLVWMAVGLLPYVFLTYMHRVPSRHTYIASLGLALVVGAALRQAKAPAVLALVVALNVGYLWIRKRPQFLERAAPTESLIAAARKAPGPVYVRCFPLAPITAEAAARLGAGKRVVWTREPGATDYCFERRP